MKEKMDGAEKYPTAFTFSIATMSLMMFATLIPQTFGLELRLIILRICFVKAEAIERAGMKAHRVFIQRVVRKEKVCGAQNLPSLK